MGYKLTYLLIFASVSFVWQTNSDQADRVVLSRPVELKSYRGTSASAAAALLTHADVTGGIVAMYEACGTAKERDFLLRKTTLHDGLDYLSSSDEFHDWTVIDGQVLIGKGAVGSTILGVSIDDADLELDKPLSLSTQRLLQSKQVQAKIAKMSIEDQGSVLGFGKVNIARPEAKPAVIKHVHSVKLYEALNSLAAANGHAVWLYEQFRCGSKISFRISWVVQ